MREVNIRISDEEREQIKNYRDKHFHESVPYGYVIAEALEKAEGSE